MGVIDGLDAGVEGGLEGGAERVASLGEDDLFAGLEDGAVGGGGGGVMEVLQVGEGLFEGEALGLRVIVDRNRERGHPASGVRVREQATRHPCQNLEGHPPVGSGLSW